MTEPLGDGDEWLFCSQKSHSSPSLVVKPQYLHILRQWRNKVHMLPSNRMSKLHTIGMQCLSTHKFHIRIVEIISNQRKTEIFHMNTNLMGTTRFQMKGDKAVPVFLF